MVRLFTLLVVVLVPGSQSLLAQDAALIERGVKVYAAERCATCHAIDGKGNQKGPLDGIGSKLSADEIRLWIVNAPEMTAKTKAERRPFMRAYTNIQKADLEALLAYMQSLKK